MIHGGPPTVVVYGPPLSSKTTLLLSIARAHHATPRSILITPDPPFPPDDHKTVGVSLEGRVGPVTFQTIGGGVLGQGPWSKLLSTASDYLLTVPAWLEPSAALEWMRQATVLAGRRPSAIAITKTDLASASAATELKSLFTAEPNAPPVYFTSLAKTDTMLRPLEYFLLRNG